MDKTPIDEATERLPELLNQELAGAVADHIDAIRGELREATEQGGEYSLTFGVRLSLLEDQLEIATTIAGRLPGWREKHVRHVDLGPRLPGLEG